MKKAAPKKKPKQETVLVRVNVNDVVTAYKSLNVKPIQGQYYKSNKADAFGALMAYNTMKLHSISYEEYLSIFGEEPIGGRMEKAGYNQSYISGFASGFDGRTMPELQNEDYKIGYEDGRLCWNKVKSLFK